MAYELIGKRGHHLIATQGMIALHDSRSLGFRDLENTGSCIFTREVIRRTADSSQLRKSILSSSCGEPMNWRQRTVPMHDCLTNFAARHGLSLASPDPSRTLDREALYFENGFLQESELLPDVLLATITKTRMLRSGRSSFRLTDCKVETPQGWEVDWCVRDDVFPPIRAHFRPTVSLQTKLVLKLLGPPARINSLDR
jgi:hypothetical protein